ncbi:MAG: hypothetical protein NVSMB29_04780 [Candidatus Dormibacteria bacterium]
MAGVNAQHTIVLKRLPLSGEVFQATRRVQLYADPGSTVTVMITRWGSNPYADIPKPQLVTLSGRIIH